MSPDGINPTERFGLQLARWQSLCRRVGKGVCVPVIGGQLRKGVIPLAGDLASGWAAELNYPLGRDKELAMVAEFARTDAADENDLVERFAAFAEAKIDQGIQEDALDNGHPYRLLAELPLKVYITTAFDDLMAQALRRFRPHCVPYVISSRWSPPGRDWHPAEENDGWPEASFEKPVVFHLHGRWADPPSMVLTETDHMEFTASLASDLAQNREKPTLLPPPIRDALSDGSWFFLGYGAADRNLRGLLRALGTQVQNTKQTVAVQLEQDVAILGRETAADDFLTGYFGRLLGRRVDVVLSDAQPFLAAIKAEMSGTV